MNSQKRATSLKSKLSIVITFAALVLSMTTSSSYGQRVSDDNLVAPFGVRFKKAPAGITIDEMLKTPVMMVTGPYEVVEFTVSYMPEGKEYMGPYTIAGSPRIQGAALDALQKIKENGDKKVRVFIENIKLKGPDNTTRTVTPITFTSIN